MTPFVKRLAHTLKKTGRDLIELQVEFDGLLSEVKKKNPSLRGNLPFLATAHKMMEKYKVKNLDPETGEGPEAPTNAPYDKDFQWGTAKKPVDRKDGNHYRASQQMYDYQGSRARTGVGGKTSAWTYGESVEEALSFDPRFPDPKAKSGAERRMRDLHVRRARQKLAKGDAHLISFIEFLTPLERYHLAYDANEWATSGSENATEYQRIAQTAHRKLTHPDHVREDILDRIDEAIKSDA